MPSFALNILSLLVIVAAYGPLLAEYGAQLWAKPYYQHFPFVLLASGLLVAQQLSEARERSSPYKRYWSVLAYVLAWLLLLVAYQSASPLLASISFIVLIGGLLLGLSNRLGCHFPVGPWLLLWLLIRLPLGLDRRLIESLQRFSSSLSSQALDLFGVHHLMDGNALVLADKQLFVDEACSGIISVISIVACAAIYGVWRRRSAPHTLLLMVAAAGWATLLNVVRITSIALAHVFLELDWTEGFTHTLLGLAIFALSLVALIATDWLLHAMLAEVGPRWAAQTGEPIVFGKPLVKGWDWIANCEKKSSPDALASVPIEWHRLLLKAGALSMGIVPLVAFAGLGATQLVQPTWTKPASFPAAEMAANLQEGVMPQQLLGLPLINVNYRQSDNSPFAKHSVIFEYTDGSGKQYLVSCDFPYTDWHELSGCYQGIGWTLENREVRVMDEKVLPSSEEYYKFAQLDLEKPDGHVALVTFCSCCDGGEQAIIPPTYEGLDGIAAIFSRREKSFRRPSFQVQVLASRDESISTEDRRISEQLLDEARRRFIEVSQRISSNQDAAEP